MAWITTLRLSVCAAADQLVTYLDTGLQVAVLMLVTIVTMVKALWIDEWMRAAISEVEAACNCSGEGVAHAGARSSSLECSRQREGNRRYKAQKYNREARVVFH